MLKSDRNDFDLEVKLLKGKRKIMKTEKTKKIVKKTDSEDVLELLQAAQKMQEENDTESSSSRRTPFIKCISKDNAPELKMDDEAYIKGAKLKDFVIPASKTLLGKEFDCTILGIFQMYEDKIAPEKGKKELPKIVGYWMPEQAKQLVMVKDHWYDRCYIDTDDRAHRVSPVTWVYCLINGKEELGVHMMTFRSTARDNAKKLKDILRNLGGFMAQHVVKVRSEYVEFPNFNSSTYRPVFEETEEMNFVIDAKGKLIPKEMERETAEETIKIHNQLQHDYNNCILVAKRDMDIIAALPAPDYELGF